MSRVFSEKDDPATTNAARGRTLVMLAPTTELATTYTNRPSVLSMNEGGNTDPPTAEAPRAFATPMKPLPREFATGLARMA